MSRFAAWRIRSQPLTRSSESCVSLFYKRGGGQFGCSDVSGLPSPKPRPVGLRRINGTTPSSDFLEACMAVVRGGPSTARPSGKRPPGTSRISRFPCVKLLGMLRVCDTARTSEDIAIAPSVMLPSRRHHEVGSWNEISVLNGWPAHAAVNASTATLRAACAGCWVAPADASLAVIVVRYSLRCRALPPLVSLRLLPAHCVYFRLSDRLFLNEPVRMRVSPHDFQGRLPDECVFVVRARRQSKRKE